MNLGENNAGNCGDDDRQVQAPFDPLQNLVVVVVVGVVVVVVVVEDDPEEDAGEKTEADETRVGVGHKEGLLVLGQLDVDAVLLHPFVCVN